MRSSISSKAFPFPKSMKSYDITFVDPNTISAIANQGNITALGINQRTDMWGSVSDTEEYGFYYKKMGNVEGFAA